MGSRLDDLAVTAQEQGGRILASAYLNALGLLELLEGKRAGR